MRTYQVFEGGYQIFEDAVLIMSQPFDPNKPFVAGQGQPFDTPEAAYEDAMQYLDLPEGDPVGDPEGAPVV